MKGNATRETIGAVPRPTDSPHGIQIGRKPRARDALYRLLDRFGLYEPLRRTARWIDGRQIERQILRGGQPYIPFDSAKDVYRRSLSLLMERGHAPWGDYLEFGVCHGTSMSAMYAALKDLGLLDRVRLFGFDSFEGLPPEAETEDLGTYRWGQCQTTERFARANMARLGVDNDKVTLITGWFCDTCNDDQIARHHLGKASVIMVDCDIYSSACDVLRFVEKLIAEEAIIIFDDWSWNDLDKLDMGEKRAFDEFLARNLDLEATRLPFRYSDESAVFHVTRRR